MKQNPDRIVKISQNDFVLFGLITETFNADERAKMIGILIDYQNGEIELPEAFRKIAQNHEARWAAYREVQAFGKGGRA